MNFRLSSELDITRLGKFVRSLPFIRDGKPIRYKVSISEAKSNRSLEQNSYYWLLLTKISQQAPIHMGGEYHAPEIWHEYCKRRFLGMDSGPFGEGVPKSTTKLSVSEMQDYITEVEAWAIEYFEGFTLEEAA